MSASLRQAIIHEIPVCRTGKIPLGTKGRTSILSIESIEVRPAELHSRSAEETCPTVNVSSLRSVKVATPPCAAKAAIPCGLAVRKQHEMLFAASKFEGEKNEFYGTNKSEFVRNRNFEVYSEVKDVELCRIWKRKQI